MAVVQTGRLLPFSITSLVQLPRMGSLAGFLDNSKSFAGYCSWGWAKLGHFRVPVRDQELIFCGRLIGSVYLLGKKSAR